MKSSLVRIATRKSPLALQQAEEIRLNLLKYHHGLDIQLVPMTTSGDKLLGAPLAQIGGKGLFVKELEQALIDNRADIAVHSMKDVPVDFPAGLEITTICEREDPRDAFISNNYSDINSLPEGAIIGTASIRRSCQIQALRPDIKIETLRGNVNTRLQKLDQGQYDAIILAVAGLKRLNLTSRIKQYLSVDESLPAVGQGALGIECRSDDYLLKEKLSVLDHLPTRLCVLAERTMNHVLGGGCQVPVAAYAQISNPSTIMLQGLVAKPGGKVILRAHASGDIDSAEEIGKKVAKDLLHQGADKILKDIYSTL